MKKIFSRAIVAAILVSAVSCAKVNVPPNYFTFDGIVNTTGTCTDSAGVITAVNTDNINTLTLSFAPSSQPVGPGTYTVVSSGPGTGQVSLQLIIGTSGQTYLSESEGGSEKVVVSAGTDGKVSLVGSVIEMKNINNPSDTASVNFNLVQTR